MTTHSPAEDEVARLRAELAIERAQSMADCAYTDGLEAAIARAREHLDALIGYCDWHDATLSSKFREPNVRALTHKAIAALEGNQT